MKTQIFAIICGILLSISSVSFAQSGANYKQQFSSSVSEKVCTNLRTSSLLKGNYKQNSTTQASFNNAVANEKCCDVASCSKSECCKDGSCTKDCCNKNNVSADYKHSSHSNVKGGGCTMNTSCGEHKDVCCN